MKYIIDKKDLKIFAEGIRSTKSMSIDEHIEEFCKELKEVEEIIVGGLQGSMYTNDMMLFISEEDFLKNLDFNKIYVIKI